LQLVKELTTLEEFGKWQAYFYRRKLEHEKLDWYLASIAHTVAGSIGGSKLPLDKYLLKFEAPVVKVTSPEESKAIWLAS
ncbi:hypothetical protein OEK97_28625, partial [Escherichia coli]|uniref:phage tail assembly protein T n=1 Tax=Escherichia coli TaxID=562 RepID=UPI0021D830A3